MPDEAESRCAERGSGGDFPLSPGRAGEKEIRDVCTGDQQDAGDADKKDQQRRTDIAGKAFLKGEDAQRCAFVETRIGGSGHVEQGREVRASLRDTDPGSQPSDSVPICGGLAGLFRAERHERIDAECRWKDETGRKDAGDPAQAAIKLDGLFHDLRVRREFGFPERMGNDDGPGRVWARVFRKKPAT